MSDPRYSEARYGEVTFGGTKPATPRSAFEAPWAFGQIRVDGIAADNPVDVVAPGTDVTYRVVIAPVDGVTDHRTRATALRKYWAYAKDVVVYETTGEVPWREQYGSRHLLRIEPLAAGSDALRIDGDLPPRRDSYWPGRWAVVRDGQDLTVAPENQCVLELTATTIASTDDYETETAVRNALEFSGPP